MTFVSVGRLNDAEDFVQAVCSIAATFDVEATALGNSMTVMDDCKLKDTELVGKSAGLVVERLRVPISAEPVGEFSSPKLTLCADSYSVSVPPPCYRSGT